MKLLFHALRLCPAFVVLVAAVLFASVASAAVVQWEDVTYTDPSRVSEIAVPEAIASEQGNDEPEVSSDETENGYAVSIPEPAAIALLAGGLASMGLMRWRLG